MQQKIKQPDILAQLKLDGLLFDHIYSDLMMLVKSQKLNKSALDMNIHYLELKGFLEELTQDPQQIINPNYEVFPSEPMAIWGFTHYQPQASVRIQPCSRKVVSARFV